MVCNIRAFTLVIIAALYVSFSARAGNYVPVVMDPPAVEREFRGAWVATVGNIDWPSKPGLTVKQQQDEFLAILDRAVKLHLNAIVFQVRPACDAMYSSKLEPWSGYLSGTMGAAPQPFYDPLEFAVTEAHRRGLELHAWFNPFRAALLPAKMPMSSNHISHTHPDWVRKYGTMLWLDPGEKKVQDYSLRVVMDVVRRYDIDGVHFDDYFYPYKEQDAQHRDLEFPDEASWKKYGAGGKLSHEDWRRENVNTFVRHVYESIKETKPWVKFGIAPFGIWQPGYPAQIKGFNAYNVLYGDSRKWLTNGWVDYLAPQLYWAIAPPDQSFPVLLKWWEEQNPKHRNIWPGLDSERVGGKWAAFEIINQIKTTRELSGSSAGSIHWADHTLMSNRGNLATELENGPYSAPALIPSSPWLEKKAPGKPKLMVDGHDQVNWQPAAFDKISAWVVQTKANGSWRTAILPGDARHQPLTDSPEIVAVTAIDRCGVASPAMVVKRSDAK
ncbi:MAG TPA: family 10 glycosylhydrolase [Verrucomicrobiae bacterium]|jgi:uncharacterized lipoprotein YddW (UPF0748 family)|nr:family 10 glycosylhydrolase [Verrucomicrobiae bacterium]